MKYAIYGAILESYVANEIAEDMRYEDGEELTAEQQAAKTWFTEVIPDGEYEFEEMPLYHQWVCNLESGWEMYYDYGASYYFAINEKINQNEEE